MSHTDDVRTTMAARASSLSPGHNISASSPIRPTSSYTSHSTFADSAVDMDGTTPTETPDNAAKNSANYFELALPSMSQDVDQSLSDKMRQLAAVAWALEQDDSMTADKRNKSHQILQDLEAYLEAVPDDLSEVKPVPVNRQDWLDVKEVEDDVIVEDPDQHSDGGEEWIDESELIAVQQNLAATVKSMHLRHEEQRHLHELTVRKLEAVAQRCIGQEQQAQNLLREMRELQSKNHNLSSENDQLRERLASVEVEAVRNEVAVEAMSSAVTGLEGWIESTQASLLDVPVANQRPRRQKVVIRGKGRFRGRYYVDEDGDEALAYSLSDTAAESQELHDGVKAWLRGFRDVEEELRQHESPSQSHPQERLQIVDNPDGDDWGDFQSP